MVVLLSWAAGSVDAISYLGLGHVFTANMTGNAVLLGLALGQGQGFAALRSIVALAGFGLGVALGASVVGHTRGAGDWPREVTKAIGVEAIALTVFTLAWHIPAIGAGDGRLYILIGLSALAMGVQSAAMRHLEVPGIATTYITGTLTSVVASLVTWLGPADISSMSAEPAHDPAGAALRAAKKRHRVRLQAVVLFIYGFAAVASGLIQTHWAALVTLVPLVAVAIVYANGVVRERQSKHLSP